MASVETIVSTTTQPSPADSAGGHAMRSCTSRFLSQRQFLLYKAGLAVYFACWSVYWFVVNDNFNTGLYLTYWTWFATGFYLVVSTLTAFLGLRAMKMCAALEGPAYESGSLTPATSATVSSPPLPMALRLLQITLWSMSCVGSLIVVGIFWGALYDGEDLTTVDVNAHILVAVAMLIDQFLVAEEFKFRYVLLAQLIGVLYLAFNIIWYYLAPEDNKLIYVILDWSDNTLVACIYGGAAMLVLAPLFALLHVGICRLRERIYEKRMAAGKRTIAQGTQAMELRETGGFGLAGL